MARYTGPKAKVNRRLQAQIFENNGARKAADRRDTPPGMHTRRGKQSSYGVAMAEKQKIKYYYGLGERQLRRYFDIARRQGEATGNELLMLCERRLDNVVRRAGFTRTRPQARQGVAHGHFTVNGRKTDVPSMLVRAGDVIRLQSRANLWSAYRAIREEAGIEAADWLTVDPETNTILINRLPDMEDVSLPVDVNKVVELLTR